MATSLKDSVDEWLLLDRNPETRKEIQLLWDRQDVHELEKRLRTRIEFGTAGLRGRMEAGWSRMNDLIIAQTSQGLSDYVLQHVKDAPSRGLVVGYDHRHHSERWAHITASIFVAKGIKVTLLRGFSHTPLVPFSVKRLNAACGVMITASHNPKARMSITVVGQWTDEIPTRQQDNGYKIISPHDHGISLAIKANSKKSFTFQSLPSSDLLVDRTQTLRKEYSKYLTTLLTIRDIALPSRPKFVNTSMHGVGDVFVSEAFASLGIPSYTPVKEQQYPDPEFPTVAFPNPEEKGALDLAIQTAEREGADYVLSQDPDADRFTAAEKRSSGEWILFTGDQLGVVFASNILEAYKSAGKPLNNLAMVASTVSSRMLEAMAQVEGFKFVECLTGFKYIGNTALRLEGEGFDVPFGYEEAIGFMFGQEIRDKDGVAATVHFVHLATSLHAQGKTVNDHLQSLYQRYGYFKTRNSYFVCNDPQVTEDIFSRIRNYESSDTPGPAYPKSLAGLEVYRVIDLTTGYDSANPPSYSPHLPLSSGQMIQFRAGDKSRGVNVFLTLRTSGTEPKIKFYLEGNGDDAGFVDKLLAETISDLSSNWIQINKYNLVMA